MSSQKVIKSQQKNSFPFIGIMRHHKNLAEIPSDKPDQISVFKDPSIQTGLKSYSSAIALNKKYTTESKMTFGDTTIIRMPKSEYLGEIYLRFNLAVSTNGTNPNIRFVLAAGGGAAFTGNLHFTVRQSLPSLDLKDTFSEVSGRMDQTAGAVELAAALNATKIITEAGGVGVVLNAGTVAAGTADFTITYTKDLANPPVIEFIYELSETTSGISPTLAKTVGGGVSYNPYPGLNMIKSVRILQGSEELHYYQYQDVMSILFSCMDDERRNFLKRAAGGRYFESGTVFSIIPTFWSKFVSGKCDNFLYPQILINQGDLILEIELNSAASLCNSNGSASLNSARIYAEEYVQENQAVQKHKLALKINRKYIMQSVDWTTLSRSTVSTATSTDLDVSGFNGNVQSIYLNSLVKSVFDVGNMYYQSDLDSYQLVIDGEEYKRSDDKNNIYFDNSLFGIKDDKEFSSPTLITYAKDPKNMHDYSGSFHTRDTNKQVITLQHTAGEDVYIRATAVLKARYCIDVKGRIIRKR